MTTPTQDSRRERPVRVLLVDDQALVRMGFRLVLEDLVGEEGAIAAAAAAGLVTMIGMYFLVRSPRDRKDEADQHEGAASESQ